MSKQLLMEKSFKKYAKFYSLIELSSSQEEKKLIAELFYIYVTNNNCFPSMFYLNNEYSEDLVSSILQKLNTHIKIDWTKIIEPLRNITQTCVKIENMQSRH